MKTEIKKVKTQAGYLLVESIIAISVATVGILGVLSILSRSLSFNRLVSDQFIGNYLAVEGIEVVKNLIDGNVIQQEPWNEGFSTGSFELDFSTVNLPLTSSQDRNVLFDGTNNTYNYSIGMPTNFKRRVEIELLSSEEMKVNSIVEWTSRGGAEFSVNLEDHFFNWRY